MDKTKLEEVLALHKLFLDGKEGGVGANLRDADLHRANLRMANLHRANLHRANLREADLRDADLRDADLREADLRDADLCWANLRDADLSGADLDFSCLPLGCGSLDIKVDKRLFAQLLYHLCRLDCDDEEVKAVQKLPEIMALANQFHRVEECGKIE
jgi:hypothetical protein